VKNMNQKIAVIDSGVGGVTVLDDMMKLMPNEHFLYIGDTLNNPYGDKSTLQLKLIIERIVRYLNKQDLKLVVIACNTLSSILLEDIQKSMRVPVLGMIDATARVANEWTKEAVGLIATKKTVESKAYNHALKHRVYSKATPRLVPIIENKQFNLPIGRAIIHDELEYFKSVKFDTFILGCTHYPIIEHIIKEHIPHAKIISSGKIIASDVRELLKQKDMTSRGKGSCELYATKDIVRFETVIKEWFKHSYTISLLKL
jgi:glutamate racemase